MQPKTLFWALMMILVWGVLGASLAVAKDSSESVVRKVHGEVVAVNVHDSPQVIVVRTKNFEGKELVVGATVESGAAIMRGGQRITLNNIREGETVDLTYVKRLDGLVARSIHVR